MVEIIRAGMKPRSGMLKICTMMKSTKYCDLPGVRGKKWPTLSELHFKLFGKDFENSHDANGDVMATKNCLFELFRLGVIPMPTAEEIAGAVA